MQYLFVILLTALLRPLPLAAQPPGFSADPRTVHPAGITGRWINEFYFARTGQAPRLFWQIVEFAPDGRTEHSYFSLDPTSAPSTPYTSIVSTWQAGLFVDPQANKGILSVIRLKPSEQINYDATRNQFQHIRGNFGAQFRRYTLSSDGAQLTLSELVVLEVPGNIIISFPATARDMIFRRVVELPSAVSPISWAQLKQQY